MKIQSKLVFDKHSNELIGFVDLGGEELNVSSGSSDLATHALVFFVRGAASDLKYAWLLSNQRCNFISDNAFVLESSICARAGM